MMRFSLRAVSILLALASFAGSAQAQGTSIGRPWLFGAGIACDASLLPWRSVWLGHFSGGIATYHPGDLKISLDWRDEKLCFPSRRSCMAWQRALHRQFHEPAGYWTCLLLR
jgi:hypothetical protein